MTILYISETCYTLEYIQRDIDSNDTDCLINGMLEIYPSPNKFRDIADYTEENRGYISHKLSKAQKAAKARKVRPNTNKNHPFNRKYNRIAF